MYLPVHKMSHACTTKSEDSTLNKYSANRFIKLSDAVTNQLTKSKSKLL